MQNVTNCHLDNFVFIALPYLLMIVILVACALILRYGYGQSWWCACGKLRLWADAVSSHNSQHVADPYSFTHFLHGLIFYWIIYWIPVINVHYRALIALTIEVIWEIIENSPCVIDKYRQETISLGYTGDSVTNSICDSLLCLSGFYFAYWHTWYISLIVAIVFESMLAWWIRDNLVLNLFMLICCLKAPKEAVKNWQQGINDTTEQNGSETSQSQKQVLNEPAPDPETVC